MSERPLWAPWRIEYITGPKEEECIFCLAASGASTGGEPAIDRAGQCITILNRFPYAPGHVMVAPARHVAALEDLTEAETLDLMRLARRVILALRGAMSPGGFNVGLNLGAVAGAGIADHLHLHVVPRWQGDNNFMPVIADIDVIPQALDATRAALADALAQLPDDRAPANEGP